MLKRGARGGLGVIMILGSWAIHGTELQKSPVEIAHEVIALLQSAEHADYIGEPVSQLQHALQCAQLAVNAHADDETVLAALLHDVGHICAPEDAHTMGAYGIDRHEQVGASFVAERGFGPKVAALIRGHVEAKRYLTYKNPDYYNKLSDASKQTLAMQGGPMSDDQGRAFEADPLFEQKLQMRLWDEQAKREKWIGLGLAYYQDLMVRHLTRMRDQDSSQDMRAGAGAESIRERERGSCADII
jgi:2-amino-1-hydroxyethylphosphonate dioxygenase (glycine-forming)